jgi:hypothetical protein
MDKSEIIKALRNGAQSASNAVADTAAIPVDLLSEGLRAVGAPMPQNPVLGSQWMREKGLTAPVEPGLSADIGYGVGGALQALPMNYGRMAREMADGIYDAKKARQQAQ